MKIEKGARKDNLAYNPLQYSVMSDEGSDPYDHMLLVDEPDVSIRMTGSSALQYDSFEMISRVQFSEEEEMLLNFLLPNRLARQMKCIKTVNYPQFIGDSIREYEQQQISQLNRVFKEINS